MIMLYSVSRYTGPRYKRTNKTVLSSSIRLILNGAYICIGKLTALLCVQKLYHVVIIVGYASHWRNITRLSRTRSWSKSWNGEWNSLQVCNTHGNKRNEAWVISLWICTEGLQHLQWQNIYFLWRWENVTIWRWWSFAEKYLTFIFFCYDLSEIHSIRNNLSNSNKGIMTELESRSPCYNKLHPINFTTGPSATKSTLENIS